MTKRRSGLSDKLRNKLLVEANHACTICGHPGVQIHHIDGDSSNNSEDNLIVLCLKHHDEAERSKAGRGLSSNLTPDQLREYKRRLKAGRRPTASQTKASPSVQASVNNVTNSQINIAGGDVTVGLSSTPSSNPNNDSFTFDASPPMLSSSNKNSQGDFTYDVFISYSHRDEDWVRNQLLPCLRDAGLKVCIDRDCFEPGAPIITEIERAVLTSRKTVLVLTPDYLNSAWAEMENILVATLDPSARNRRIIPLLLKKCDLPLRLRSLIYLDLARRDRAEIELKRLVYHLKRSFSSTGASESDTDDEDYRLSKYFRSTDDDSSSEDPLPWRPQVDLDTIDEDEQDIRYLDTLASQGRASPEEYAAWRRQLAELKSNLLLIEERLSEFVMDTDPANLQLVKRKRELEKQIADLKKMLAARCAES